MEEKEPRNPRTATSQAEYNELMKEHREWVRKHGHRMLDTEEEPWEYIPAPQEKTVKDPKN